MQKFRVNINEDLRTLIHRQPGVKSSSSDYTIIEVCQLLEVGAEEIFYLFISSIGKTFSKSWNFIDHALMHEGIKPFKCER